VAPFTLHVYVSHALIVVVLLVLGVIVNTKVWVPHPLTLV